MKKIVTSGRRRIFCYTVLPAFALGLAGASPSLAQEKTITLGAAVQLTGSLANIGRYYGDAYNFAIDTINAKGGVTAGGVKYQLKLDLLDNQSDVNLGVRQYVKLVTQDKVDFLLGPFTSDDALDDSSVSEKYQIPMVQGGGASTRFSRAATNMSSARCRRRTIISSARST